MEEQRWLTLSEASEFLGVHFTSLRSWSDQGEIRVFRTPGGHRRFGMADLRRFLAERVSSTEIVQPDEIMASALGRVRQEMQKIPSQELPWRDNLDEATRQIRRERGRELFALALSFVLKPGQRQRILEQGRVLGRAYGSEAALGGVSLAESGRAVQFFRKQLSAAVHAGEIQSAMDVEDVRVQRLIDQFLDEILYAVLDGYESHSSG